MSFVAGYHIGEKLYESRNSLVFRAVRDEDALPVVIKILKNDYPTPTELARYRREFEATRSLNIPGVIRSYEQRRHEKTLLIVFEDFGGRSVRELLAERPLSLNEFLDAAIQVVEAIGQLHHARIIHKDINPSNLVINPGTGEVKIIDFGTSTRFTTEHPVLRRPEVLEGTLAYMSPEQTGRMNRPLDYRTDFYSLGATFYEMLTRKPPFEADDDMELVHCHIAREPLPPHRHNPDVPLALSKIVGKLLAKKAENRYQSAGGLLADLETVRSRAALERFEPGRNDYSDRFLIPDRLYGREQEVKRLLDVFERTLRGRAELMLVGGYSGVGKTALIQEVHKPITRAHGYFIAGKFDQLRRNIPYSGLVAAFGDLVRQLLTESEERLASWRRELNDALAPNGQVILDVLPDLELVIGPQPPVPELSPDAATNRFNRAIGQLLRALCAEDHVLALFLDDLQWADSATLNLLRLVITDETMERLFLVGAFRENEVDAMHPVSLALRDIRDGGGPVTTLTLAPLGLADVAKLLSDTLQADTGQVTPLARLVVQKTQGNPLFARQFLSALHRDGLIAHGPGADGARPRWRWNIDAIRAAPITDNVADLLVDKLRRLDNETQDALRLAACIGNRFDVETLALVCDSTQERTHENLQAAVQEELIRPVSESTPLDAGDVLSPLLVQEYRFQHDRVQQTAYGLIEKDRRKGVHLQIGQRLLATLPPAALKERLFEIVDHLDVGRDLLAAVDERRSLARLNVDAGRKASDATAYAAALAYLQVAHELLGDGGWQDAYDLTIAVHRDRADLEYLNGNFARCSELVGITLEHARTDLEKAEVYFTRIAQHTLLTEFQQALDAGWKALALLGIDLPLDDPQAAGVVLGRIAATLGDREIASLYDNPDVGTPEMALAQRCLRHLTITAFLSNQDLFPLIVATATSLSLEHGNAPESALGYANYGLILGAFTGRYREGYEFGRLALRLCSKFEGRAPTATVCLVMGAELAPWVEHVRHAVPVIDRGYREALDSGDILWAGYLVMYRVVLDAFGGKRLDELLDAIPDQLGFTSRTKNPGAGAGILAHQIVAGTLAGRTKSSTDFSAPDLDEARFLRFCEQHDLAMATCFYRILKAQALYLFGRPREALDATDEVAPMLRFIVNHPNLADHRLYQSLALAALWHGGTSDTALVLDRMRANLEQLRTWADGCPANYQAKRLMVEAELARITGDESAAATLYDQAIEAAHDAQFVHDEALANELAARFVMERRPTSRIGVMYLRDARYAYRMWGAHRKVEELETEFPQLLAEYGDTHAAGATLAADAAALRPSTMRTGSATLDLHTLLKASQTISGEVVLGRLLQRLMDILIENAGAQRGLFLLERGGELYIEAEGSVVSDDVAVLMSIPIDSPAGSSRIPQGVVHFAARTREAVVVDDAQLDERFLADPYVQKHETRSILCQPILHQGRLIGMVYLENNLTNAAFTPERAQLLALLSGQIAVSIQNAELVENLEEKVRERTIALDVRTRFIEQTFGRYLSTEVADTLLKSPEALDFGGQKRTATIMMSDVRGFASFSEVLSPERIVMLLNNYLSEMTTVIQKHHGTIDEFIGDAILVVFGAPFQRPDDADRAVACALEMQAAMARVNEWNAARGLPGIEMGIGINTGEVVVGNIGSRNRAKYGVVGSNVNLAGRIEGYTVGGQILIAKSTRDAVRTPLTILSERVVEPKGAARPITVYEVGGIGGAGSVESAKHGPSWVELRPELACAFRLLSGKEIVGAEVDGAFVRISANEAQLRSPSPPAPYTDLRLLLQRRDGSRLNTVVYAKVLPTAADADGCFAVRFTSVPREAREFLDSLRTGVSA
jgi:predicted ATPase/class 3 adenylate cyclase